MHARRGVVVAKQAHMHVPYEAVEVATIILNSRVTMTRQRVSYVAII
jgi:hypothetical protein